MGQEHPDSIGSSAAQRLSSITAFCSKQIIKKAAAEPGALGRGAETPTSIAPCLPPFPSSIQAFPDVATRGVQAGGSGIPRPLVALLTPRCR